jgi:molybdate transport system substrate-binding protein
MRRALFVTLLMLSLAETVSGEAIRVGVAVSMKEAMTEIASAYEKQTGTQVKLTFGSSGQISAQIKGGAAIDAFISAADKQVDQLAAEGLVDSDTRRIVAGNTLVVIVPRDSKAAMDSFESLARAPVKRLAVGEPKTVPAGQYAMQALDKLKLTSALSDKLVYGSNARQVLGYVARGEVTAGIVYATDAKQMGEKVKVVATAPADVHDPIVYPAVVVKRSGSAAAAAQKFLEYLTGEDARRIFEAHGFTRPPAKPDPAGRRP